MQFSGTWEASGASQAHLWGFFKQDYKIGHFMCHTLSYSSNTLCTEHVLINF